MYNPTQTTNEEASTSPVFGKKTVIPVTMNFIQAMAEVIAGKKVTRQSWDSNEEYGFLVGGWLELHHQDGKDYIWQVSEGDMLGVDWMILPAGD